jgi:N-acetylmuramoyl-L-alanine amidase
VRRRLALFLAPLVLGGLAFSGLLRSGLLQAQQETPPQETLPPDATAAPEPEPPGAAPPATMDAVLTVGTEPPRSLRVLPGEAGPRFPLAVLAPALGAQLRPGPGGIGWMLITGESEAILAGGSRLTTVGRQIVELSQPVAGGEGGPWVPMDLLQRTFGESLHWSLAWSEPERRLSATVQQQRQLAVDWNLVNLQGISTMVLQFAETPRLRVHPAQPLPDGRQRLEVELLGDQLAVPTRQPAVSDPLVHGLAFDGNRIVLDVAPGAVVEHYQQQGPFRLVFDVYQRVAAGPDAPIAPPPQVPTIVIDPGHGGVETGAIGPAGTHEKELTLLLAQSLARELQRRLPVRVELTRDEDADLPLDTRAAIANQHRAALFISIHLNSSLGAGAHGAETYFLSLDATDARAAASARAENARAENRPGGGGLAAPPQGAPEGGAFADPDLQLILWDLAQTRHLTESQRFANLVQAELNGALGLRDRGVKQAPFRVLMGAAMPAVLVELGFLSNPDEERKLLAADYRGQLVEALVRAVSRYQGRATEPPRAEAAPAGAPTTR